MEANDRRTPLIEWTQTEPDEHTATTGAQVRRSDPKTPSPWIASDAEGDELEGEYNTLDAAMRAATGGAEPSSGPTPPGWQFRGYTYLGPFQRPGEYRHGPSGAVVTDQRDNRPVSLRRPPPRNWTAMARRAKGYYQCVGEFTSAQEAMQAAVSGSETQVPGPVRDQAHEVFGGGRSRGSVRDEAVVAVAEDR